MFQLLREERGPRKLTWFRAQGTPGLPGPELLVQSQRRQRFWTTMVETGIRLWLWRGDLGTDDRVRAE